MKLSYKTNAWQKLSWNEHCDLAEKMELDGLELCYSPAESTDLISDLQHKQQFLRRLSEKQLEIACVSVDVKGDEDTLDTALRNAADCIELARVLRTPYVCLDMDFECDKDEARLITLIGVLMPKAKTEGITLLIETKGVCLPSGCTVRVKF